MSTNRNRELLDHEEHRRRVKQALLVDTPLNNGLLEEDDYIFLERLKLKEQTINRQVSSVRSLLMKFDDPIQKDKFEERNDENNPLTTGNRKTYESDGIYQSPTRNVNKSNQAMRNSLHRIQKTSILENRRAYHESPIRQLVSSVGIVKPEEELPSALPSRLSIQDLSVSQDGFNVQDTYDELMKIRERREEQARERLRKKQEIIESYERQQLEAELKEREQHYIKIAKNHFSQVMSRRFISRLLLFFARSRKYGMRLYIRGRFMHLQKHFEIFKHRTFLNKLIQSQGTLAYYKILFYRFRSQVIDYSQANSLYQMKTVYKATQHYKQYRLKKAWKEMKFLLLRRQSSETLVRMHEYYNRRLLLRYFPIFLSQIEYYTRCHQTTHRKLVQYYNSIHELAQKQVRVFFDNLRFLTMRRRKLRRAKVHCLKKLIHESFPVFQILKEKIYFNRLLEERGQDLYETRRKSQALRNLVDYGHIRRSIREKCSIPSSPRKRSKTRRLFSLQYLNLETHRNRKECLLNDLFRIGYSFRKWWQISNQRAAATKTIRNHMLKYYENNLTVSLVQDFLRSSSDDGINGLNSSGSKLAKNNLPRQRFLQQLKSVRSKYQLGKKLFLLKRWKFFSNRLSELLARREFESSKKQEIQVLNRDKMRKFFRALRQRLFQKKRLLNRIKSKRQRKIRHYWISWKRQLFYHIRRKHREEKSLLAWRNRSIEAFWQRWRTFMHRRRNFPGTSSLSPKKSSKQAIRNSLSANGDDKNFFYSSRSLVLLKFHSFFENLKIRVERKQQRLSLIRKMRADVYNKLLKQSLKEWYHFIFEVCKKQYDVYSKKGRMVYRQIKLRKFFADWRFIATKRLKERSGDVVLKAFQLNKLIPLTTSTAVIPPYPSSKKSCSKSALSLSLAEKKKRSFSLLAEVVFVRRYFRRWAVHRKERLDTQKITRTVKVSKLQLNRRIKENEIETRTKRVPKPLTLSFSDPIELYKFRARRNFYHVLYQKKESSIYLHDTVSAYYYQHQRSRILRKYFLAFNSYIEERQRLNFNHHVAGRYYRSYRYGLVLAAFKRIIASRQSQNDQSHEARLALSSNYYIPRAFRFWKLLILKKTLLTTDQKSKIRAYQRYRSFQKLKLCLQRYYYAPRQLQMEATQHYRLRYLFRYWRQWRESKEEIGWRQRSQQRLVRNHLNQKNIKNLVKGFSSLIKILGKRASLRKKRIILQQLKYKRLLVKAFQHMLHLILNPPPPPPPAHVITSISRDTSLIPMNSVFDRNLSASLDTIARPLSKSLEIAEVLSVPISRSRSANRMDVRVAQASLVSNATDGLKSGNNILLTADTRPKTPQLPFEQITEVDKTKKLEEKKKSFADVQQSLVAQTAHSMMEAALIPDIMLTKESNLDQSDFTSIFTPTNHNAKVNQTEENNFSRPQIDVNSVTPNIGEKQPSLSRLTVPPPIITDVRSVTTPRFKSGSFTGRDIGNNANRTSISPSATLPSQRIVPNERVIPISPAISSRTFALSAPLPLVPIKQTFFNKPSFPTLKKSSNNQSAPLPPPVVIIPSSPQFNEEDGRTIVPEGIETNISSLQSTTTVNSSANNRMNIAPMISADMFRSYSMESLDSVSSSVTTTKEKRNEFLALNHAIKYHTMKKTHLTLFTLYHLTQLKRARKNKIQVFLKYCYFRRLYNFVSSTAKLEQEIFTKAARKHRSYKLSRALRLWRSFLKKHKLYSFVLPSRKRQKITRKKSADEEAQFRLEAVSSIIQEYRKKSRRAVENLEGNQGENGVQEQNGDELKVLSVHSIRSKQFMDRLMRYYFIQRWRRDYHHGIVIPQRRRMRQSSIHHHRISVLRGAWRSWRQSHLFVCQSQKPAERTGSTHHASSRMRRCLTLLSEQRHRRRINRQENSSFRWKWAQIVLWRWKQRIFGLRSARLEVTRLMPSDQVSQVVIIISSSAKASLKSQRLRTLSYLYSERRLFPYDFYLPQKRMHQLQSILQLKKASFDSDVVVPSDTCISRSRHLLSHATVFYNQRKLQRQFFKFREIVTTSQQNRSAEQTISLQFQRKQFYHSFQVWKAATERNRLYRDMDHQSVHFHKRHPLSKCLRSWKYFVRVARAASLIQRKRYQERYFKLWFERSSKKRRVIKFLVKFTSIFEKEYVSQYFLEWKYNVRLETKLAQHAQKQSKRLLAKGWSIFFHNYHHVRNQQRLLLRFANQRHYRVMGRKFIKELLKDIGRKYNQRDLLKRSVWHCQLYQKGKVLQNMQYLKRNRIALAYFRFRSFQLLLHCLRQNLFFYRNYRDKILRRKVHFFQLRRGLRNWKNHITRKLQLQSTLHKRNRHRFFQVLQRKCWIVQEAKQERDLEEEETEQKNSLMHDTEVDEGSVLRALERKEKDNEERRKVRKDRFLKKLSFRQNRNRALSPSSPRRGSITEDKNVRRGTAPQNESVSTKTKFYQEQDAKFQNFYDTYATKQRLFYFFQKLSIHKQQRKKTRHYLAYYTQNYFLGRQLHKCFHRLLKHRSSQIRKRRNFLYFQQLSVQLQLKRYLVKLDYQRVVRWKVEQENRLGTIAAREKLLRRGMNIWKKRCPLIQLGNNDDDYVEEQHLGNEYELQAKDLPRQSLHYPQNEDNVLSLLNQGEFGTLLDL